MIDVDRIKTEFCKLVEMDSESFNERQIADYLKIKLEEFGFDVFEDNVGEKINGNAGNLYAYLKGDIEGEPLLFSAHMDTVVPGKSKKSVIDKNGTIKSNGKSVLGADDISGIVSILEAIRCIKENNISHRSLEILFTVAEEVYIKGSKEFDYSKIKSKEAYTLDLSGPVGCVALSAPSIISFKANIIGKASHSGFSPELGINSIAIMTSAISKLKQGRINKYTTFNIGKIKGGAANNIVSEKCSISGEIRSFKHQEAVEFASKFERILLKACEANGAKLEFETDLMCRSYNINLNEPVVKKFVKVCHALGYKSEMLKTFGGSDNNVFVEKGISGIVIACGMNSVHSTDEYTSLEELSKCANIVIGLMTKI